MSTLMLTDGVGSMDEATSSEMILWYELHRLQERYVGTIDSDHLEEWPNLFTEDGIYEIVPKENADLDLPMGIVHCFGRQMMRDRIVALRKANVFEPHTYRHMISGMEFIKVSTDTLDTHSNYVVIQTLSDGESRIFQAGRYIDRVVRTINGWRYQRKLAVYDTSRVQTLLVTPI